jgi:flagellar motility protein MotE (MotC chaperone)
MSIMSFIRELRLIPIALIASSCLLALKAADLLLDGGHWLAGNNAPLADARVIHAAPGVPQPGMKLSWAQEMFNFPDAQGSAPASGIAPSFADRASLDTSSGDITGSITAGSTGTDPKPDKPVPPPNGTIIPTDGAALPSGAERAILERLAQRREELDTRGRELDIRENLIKAAEKRIDARLAELKEVEARIVAETQQKDDAEAARLKGLVTMYENMKARDAAKIFDRLEMPVLLQMASQINPRQMAEILAQMSPDMAQRLTVEMASRAQHPVKSGPAELPKIEGQATAQ